MIYFDLDGVLRDLSGYLFGDRCPQTWEEEVSPGISFADAVRRDMDSLWKAKKTVYCDIIKEEMRGLPIHILTCQPKEWRDGTERWLRDNICDYRTGITLAYVYDINEKLARLDAEDALVDDYPGFKDYSRVVLVGYPYNDCVIAKTLMPRVTTPEQMVKTIRALKMGAS